MLDRLPVQLQQCVLLEWLSPRAVCVVARAGSAVLRSVVLTSPRAFQAAEGEVLPDAIVRWFREMMRVAGGPPPLLLWTAVEIDERGDRFHTCNGKLHNDGDLPAVIRSWGTQHWYQHGERHRDGDKPAVVWEKGEDESEYVWFQHGKRHRDGDLPAVIWSDGTQLWYRRGKLHRDGLPAVIWADGKHEWWIRDRRVFRIWIEVRRFWNRLRTVAGSSPTSS